MKISTRFFFFMGFFFVMAAASVIIIVNIYMRKNALLEAEQKANVLLENMMAVQTYFSHQLRPTLLKNIKIFQTDNHFDPRWMSASYAIRQILKYSHPFLQGDYYYKECATNARSPENEATDYEIDFLELLKKNDKLVMKSSIRNINDRPYLVILRRGITPTKSCLRCHGKTERAPKEIIEIYGSEKSFNKKLEDLIYATSIRIPLYKAYAIANQFSIQLSLILLFLLTLLFIIQHLLLKKHVFTPLLQLQEKTTLISTNQDHLGDELNIPSGKELGNLTISFNAMSKSLRYHINNLDKMVKERTEKLSEMNTQLKNEIVERKKAELETQKNIDRYKGIFENTNHGIAVYRAVKNAKDFVFVEFNRGGEKIDQIDRKNIIGKSVIETFPAVKDFGLFDVFQRVWETGQPEFFPLKLYQGKRISGWRENYVYKLPSNEIVALYNDKTKEKQAEENLYFEKERLFVTLQSIGDGVISTDKNGNIVLINRVAEELTGYKQNDVIGKSVSAILNVFDPNTHQRLETPIATALKTGQSIDFDEHMTLVSKNGSTRNISDCAAPIFNYQQEIIGAVLVFRDVTEKIRAQLQIQQSQKMEAIGTLAAGIAHDFNNMLGIITGNVSFALSQINQKNEISDALIDTQDAAKKAISLTHQLLTFSKGGEPIKKPTNIKVFIKESANFVARGTGTKCKFVFPENLWTVDIDEGQMNQVISNIVINANQAMPEGGILTIKAININIEDNGVIHKSLIPGRYVKIEFQDQGIGISEKHLSQIFDPYFSTKQKGSGLGLASTFSIIQRHQGYITVQSQLDNGTCFTIFLPASTTRHAKTDKLELQASHAGHGKILIMDDDESILKMAGRLIKRMGYDPAFAIDGSQAIRMYSEALQSEAPFDIVILDLTVPGGMGGAKVIPELLKIDPDVTAIVSSGYSNDPVMSNYQQYGFKAVIPKPYTKNQLEKVLSKIE